MKEKMKERKDRKRSKKTEEELKEELKHVAPGSPEEAEILDALQKRENADVLREQGALIAVVGLEVLSFLWRLGLPQNLMGALA